MATSLFAASTPTQAGFTFPQAFTERYRPNSISDFVGLDKAKLKMSKLAARPYNSAWLFVGSSGTGKTAMAHALAAAIPAEVHHIPSQNCNLETIERVRRTCQYVPAMGYKFHLVIVDEADLMSPAAQTCLLSYLDGTNEAPNTIWIFTSNDVARLEDRFLSRTRQIEFSSYGIASDAAALLETIWAIEAPADAPAPNFARIVKDAKNNVRSALMSLESALMECE